MSNDPKCPYCGGIMDENNSDRLRLYKVYWYTCDNCGATSPFEKSVEAAYAAAMKRDRAKGEWEEGNYVGEIGYESEWFCSVCGYVVLSEDYPENWHFCPNCGAEMRKEANDER